MRKMLGQLVAGPGARQGAGGAKGPKRPELTRSLGLPQPQLDRVLSLRAQYVDFLPEREALGGRRHSPLARTVVIATGALFVFLFAWAAIGQVEQAVIGLGAVRPDGRVKVVNHPEGGRVAEILVREGDRVKEGQPLIRLDPEFLRDEVNKLAAQYQLLAADTARLEAEASDRPTVDFPDIVRTARPDLLATQTRLFEARREALLSRRQTVDRQIEQRIGEIGQLDSQLAGKKRGFDILHEQADSLGELAGKGYFPWLRYQSVLRELSDQNSEIDRLEAAKRSSRSALEEARTRRRQVDEDWRASVFADLNKARTDRDATASALGQASTRFRNLVITAPADGAAQGLAVNNIGQAVRPLEPLMNIVPVTGNLIIETKVANQDIGWVTIGQQARIKVHAYDFSKFGTLDAVVEQISPDAFTDEKTGATYYKVMVRSDRNYLGANPGEHQVTPGMAADVELITGHRSVLSYLTDRITATTANALREH